EGHVDLLADGHGHAAALAVRAGLLDDEVAVLVQVLELPLELARDGVDPDRRIGADGIDMAEGLPRDHEQVQDDDGRDQGPEGLDEVVAVGLGREVDVLGAAAVAEDAPDDQALDPDEDGDREREHDVVQGADLARLLGDGLRRVEGPAGGAEEDQRDDRDQEDDAATGDERARGGALPRTGRHDSSGASAGPGPGAWDGGPPGWECERPTRSASRGSS